MPPIVFEILCNAVLKVGCTSTFDPDRYYLVDDFMVDYLAPSLSFTVLCFLKNDMTSRQGFILRPFKVFR